ncbi:MAG: sigma-70 family RNA polymerase sigma factor [Gemmatimonadetes bacterium]|nr:sigma-70 family RNA polymerase sigma factor [Gemmatimonadota bacterium]
MGSLGTTRPATSTCLDEARAARWPSHPGAGSSGGFESEVLPHLPALRRLATRFVDAIVDADDLIQETMLRACRKWYQYEPGTNVRAWLMTIMRNYYVNLYRTAKRRPVMVEFDDAAQPGDSVQQTRSGPGSRSPVLTDDQVIDAIEELPAKYRQVLLLSDLDGVPLAEIARMLKIPLGTVKSRVFRARRQARAKLRRQAVEWGILDAESDVTPCPVPCRRIA